MIKPIRKLILKNLPKRLGDVETAVLTLIDSPTYGSGEDVGFNGQKGKKNIFNDLLLRYRFSNILETGTYIGDTAGYMAERSQLPVHSCEINQLLYSLAKMRLKAFPSISLYNLDSRDFLDRLGNRPEIIRNECFVYLDAHWGKNLPLKEEISIISSRWEKFIIMIDDFQVPNDGGYIYDCYGAFASLNLSYLRKTLAKFDLCTFFPSMPSREESRTRPTGCVILAKNNEYAHPLQQIPSLRTYND